MTESYGLLEAYLETSLTVNWLDGVVDSLMHGCRYRLNQLEKQTLDNAITLIKRVRAEEMAKSMTAENILRKDLFKGGDGDE